MSEFKVGDTVVRLKDGPRGVMAGQHYVVREIDPVSGKDIALEGIENKYSRILDMKVAGPYFYAEGFELVEPTEPEPVKDVAVVTGGQEFTAAQWEAVQGYIASRETEDDGWRDVDHVVRIDIDAEPAPMSLSQPFSYTPSFFERVGMEIRVQIREKRS